jgi:hypothetical protein
MTPHQTLAVVVRLFAIWLAIYIARAAPAFYREAARYRDTPGTVGAVLIAIAALALVIFLWFFPRTVALKLLDERNLAPTQSASPDTWFAVGCGLLGLWLIVPALANLTWTLSVVYLAQRDPAVDTSNLRIDSISYVIDIALGIWLLLGARGARKLFWWARQRADGP